MAVSLFASGMWIVALVWQVIAIGGGPSELSVVATALPASGCWSACCSAGWRPTGCPGGRCSSRSRWCASRAALAAALLALTGPLQLWQLAVVAFVLGAAEAFFYPAYTALLPTLLPADELLAANGVEGMLRPIAQQAARPGAGRRRRRRVRARASRCCWPARCYVVALLALLAMRPLPGRRRRPSGSLGAAATSREGFALPVPHRLAVRHAGLRHLYVLVLIGPIEVLLPFAVRDQTGGGAGGFALVLAAFGVGGAVGSLVVSSLRLPRRYLTAMLLLLGRGRRPAGASSGSPTGCG